MDQLSTIEDVMTIRRNDRRHHVALNVQVIRIAVSDRYKFLTVAVKQFRHQNVLRHLSIKCWSSDFGIIEGVKAGDFVTFRRLWKKSETRRLSGNYRLNANDLDVELFVWGQTTADVIEVFNIQNIVDFSSINGALTNARVAGRIDSTDNPGTIVILDINNNLMEVQSHDGIENYRIGSEWNFIGNVMFDAGMPVMQAIDSVCVDVRAGDRDGNANGFEDQAGNENDVGDRAGNANDVGDRAGEAIVAEDRAGEAIDGGDEHALDGGDGDGSVMDWPEDLGDLFGDLLE